MSYLRDAGASLLNVSVNNTVGYVGAYLVGASAAAGVAGMGTMIGVSLVGCAALYIPYAIVTKSLAYFGLLNELVKLTLDSAMVMGSAAVGAAIFGLAVQPFVICAVAGLIIGACISAMFAKEPANAQNGASATPAQTSRDTFCSGRQTPSTTSSINDTDDTHDAGFVAYRAGATSAG